MDPREFVPAPAQGVLAWQVRESDKELRSALLRIHRKEVASCTNVERKILKLMDGGCHLPLGAYCERDRDGNYHVWAALGEMGGDSEVRTVQYSSSTSFELAEQIAESLRSAVS
jgi:hydroxymethylbilane synthase